MIAIDQRPIGRTPRSNPVTYIKVFDEIRDFFAQLPEARVHGYEPGRFSFNVKGGRCEACQGDGVRQIEMHFLADVYVTLRGVPGPPLQRGDARGALQGQVDRRRARADRARGARALRRASRRSRGPLALLADVGLDYLHLGQPSPTLSGGEAQRIKLARELVAPRHRPHALHPRRADDGPALRRRAQAARRARSGSSTRGNTVVVIEHNLDVDQDAPTG